MKTISILLAVVFLGCTDLRAQSLTARIGLNVIPLLDRTLELNGTWTKSPNHEFFAQGGYLFPMAYTNYEGFRNQYWEGSAQGAYLRLGARALLNKSDWFRFFVGFQVTNGYVTQSGKRINILNCVVAPCPVLESGYHNAHYLLSAGPSGGVRTSLTQRVAVEVGMQLNSFIGGKPELLSTDVYIPGYGRRPLQAIATVQYVLKGR